MSWIKPEPLRPTGDASLSDKPTLTLLFAFVALNVFLLGLGKGGNSIRQIFTATAVLTGIILYRRNGPVYASFTLWLWFLSPFVRRLIDYRIGWADPNVVLLVPYIVTLLGVLEFRKLFLPSLRVFLLPIGLITAAILSGIVVGLFRLSLHDVIAGTLGWVTPMIFGMYVVIQSSDNAIYRRIVIRTVVTGSIVMSIYGIYQFVVAPPWDCYWLDNVIPDLVAPSFGHPEPFGIRVWSTINSPGTLSILLAVALVLLLARRSVWLALPVALVFLLTEVRSSWMAFGAGLIFLVFASRSFPYALQPVRRHIFILIATGAVGLVILSAIPLIGVHLQERFGSFVDLSKDASVVERTLTYKTVFAYAAGNPLGNGINPSNTLGDLAMDGLGQAMLVSFGWAGTFLFLCGLGRLMQLLVRVAPQDADTAVIRVATFVLLSMAPASNVVFGPTGLLTWMSIGLTLGALTPVASQSRAASWPTKVTVGFPVRAAGLS